VNGKPKKDGVERILLIWVFEFREIHKKKKRRKIK